MKLTVIRRLAFLAGFLALIGSVLPAEAHFSVNARTRVIHVLPAENGEGVRIAIRVPGPLAFSDALSKRAGPTAQVDAPFIQQRMVGGTPFYVLDRQAIAAGPDAFIRFVAYGYIIRANGIEQAVVPLRHSIYSVQNRTPFGEQAEVAAAFDGYRADGEDIYVGDSVIDIELLLPEAGAEAAISMVSALPEIALPPTVMLENLGVDSRFGEPRTQSYNGQMQEAVHFDGSVLSSVSTFVWQGIVHILLGFDHLIFVVCLVFAAGTLSRILWSVTGFTIGHSITLSLSFFGIAPSVAWFIPVIEVGIALSIILTGVAILFRSRAEGGSTDQMTSKALFGLTGLIGLIHGYGFSAVLFELTGGSLRSFTLELLGFNAGIEVGQLAIVAVVLAAIALMGRLNGTLPRLAGQAVACLSMAIGLWWTVERVAGMV
jgi:hypothetical protein